MRFFIIIFLFIGSACFAQEKKDSVSIQSEPEWSATNYTQEDKIYNRSVWTFADNPALAGFDRKLAVAYRFGMRNLALGVPNKDGNLVLGFMKHEASIDMPFGGPKQNWGLGLHYEQEKEMQHDYHRVKMAHSLRIKLVNSHFLILGYSFGAQFAKLNDWDGLTFGDMIDPRSGFVYQTQEIQPNTSRVVGIIEAGLKYYWKRFSFEYVYHQGPRAMGGMAGLSQITIANRFRTNYHFKVDETITVSPELILDVNNDPATFGEIEMLSAFSTITYKDMFYGQIGVVNMSALNINVGYQLRNFLVFELGVQSFLNQRMQKIAGLAGIQGSVRYQLKAWAK